jgi:hypothetical protein
MTLSDVFIPVLIHLALNNVAGCTIIGGYYIKGQLISELTKPEPLLGPPQ